MMQGIDARAVSGAVRSTGRASILVVGPGWLGSAIAATSAEQDDRVFTLSRGAAMECRAGSDHGPITTIQGDITAARSDAGLASLLAAAPASVDHVVLCVAPSRSRGDSYDSLYPAAARGAVRLAEALGARTLLYTSSTGVYGATDGSVVREDAVIVPADDRQRALLQAEEEIFARATEPGLQRIVLRVAGLYGPGRDPAPRLRSAATNADAPARWSNFAWRDDVVRAVRHLQGCAREGESHALFNCADGHPVLATDVARALERADMADDAGSSTSTAGARPPRASASSPSNQRVSIDRLLATGWSPTVPTVFDGLALLGHTVRRP